MILLWLFLINLYNFNAIQMDLKEDGNSDFITIRTNFISKFFLLQIPKFIFHPLLTHRNIFIPLIWHNIFSWITVIVMDNIQFQIVKYCSKERLVPMYVSLRINNAHPHLQQLLEHNWMFILMYLNIISQMLFIYNA